MTPQQQGGWGSWLLLGALAGAALVTSLTGSSAGPQSTMVPADRRVQRLIDADWFVLGRTQDGFAVMLRRDPATRLPDPAREAAIDRIPGLRARMSDLDGWTFQKERVTGLRVSERARDPFDNSWTWRGEIDYARYPRESVIRLIRLAEPGVLPGVIELERRPGPLTIGIGDQRPALRADAPLAMPLSGDRFDLQCANGAPAALLYRIGDQVAVNTAGISGCPVRVGEQLLNDRASCGRLGIDPAQCHFAVLRAGDMIVVGAGNAKAIRFQRRAGLGEPKVMRRDSELGKISAPGLDAFVQRIADGLGAAMSGCSNINVDLAGGCDGTLPSSLDYEAQRDAQRLLDAQAKQRASGAQKLPSTAAIVVMNARSGEVLAAAGYKDGKGGCDFTPICLYPIGSTAKPLFATAMIGGYAGGDLASLRLPYRGTEVHDILGLRFPHVLNNENKSWSGDLGLADFLQVSDNHYMAGMFLLASGVRGNCPLAGDWYQLDGKRESKRRARSAFESIDCRLLGPDVQPAFHPAWADKLKRYFGVEPYSRIDAPSEPCSTPGYFGSATYDSSPWRAILKEGQFCQMRSAGLARKWFEIGSLRDFRDRALLLALGNGEGQWNTVKLAEAYSRLATGRNVGASFIDLHGRPAKTQIDFWTEFSRPRKNGRIDARLAVSRGLARVIRGTAARTNVPGAVAALARKLEADNRRLGVFAKTGTMQLNGSATAAGCPRGDPAKGDCVGKAFVVTLAVYKADAPNLTLDPATGLAADAAAQPQCAITLAVNFFQWNGEQPNAAAQAAAALIAGTVSNRLTEKEGFCSDHG